MRLSRRIRFGDFLDCYYRSDADIKMKMTFAEPVGDDKVFLCELACATEKLSNENNLPVPRWTRKRKYFLKSPHYAFGTKNVGFQTFLQQTTPVEYSKRNLYYGENVLKRC